MIRRLELQGYDKHEDLPGMKLEPGDYIGHGGETNAVLVYGRGHQLKAVFNDVKSAIIVELRDDEPAT